MALVTKPPSSSTSFKCEFKFHYVISCGSEQISCPMATLMKKWKNKSRDRDRDPTSLTSHKPTKQSKTKQNLPSVQ